MTGKINDKISYAIRIYIVYSEHVLFVTFFYRGVDWSRMHDFFARDTESLFGKIYFKQSFYNLFTFVNKILIFDYS